jgi:hypothetical protein
MTMPFISYRAVNFAPEVVGVKSGQLPLPMAELIHGAITMGALPVGMGGARRPLLELSWRAAMIAASLEEAPRSGAWVKTDSYRRLDGSEKSAVSYFLGMTQAKITCGRLLRAPHLIHLDAFLAMIGQQTRRSRPDLVGVNAALEATIAVEAKGLSGLWKREVAEKAKKQAASLPGVRATSEVVRVASVASFDRDDRWEAYLEDPPAPLRPHASLSVGSVLTTYYRPLVAALLDASDSGEAADAEDNDMITALLPGIDLTLGIPTTIVAAMQRLPRTGTLTPRQMATTGAALLNVVRGRTQAMAPDRKSEPEDSPVQDRAHRGLDGVYVELGSTWQ